MTGGEDPTCEECVSGLQAVAGLISSEPYISNIVQYLSVRFTNFKYSSYQQENCETIQKWGENIYKKYHISKTIFVK